MSSLPACIAQSQRLIIKIGSALVTDIERGIVRKDWLLKLAEDIQKLTKDKEVIIVSSGAIALGRTPLGIDLKTPSKQLPIEQKQAAASIGQIKLINAFEHAFDAVGLQISQILLNPKDTENRRTHLNARATLKTLLDHKIIPVINENDTTATDEIRFGDNDKLAARVAQMMEADLLLILSTTDGLYTDNPDTNKDAQHIALVSDISKDILASAKEVTSGVSTGGMKSKIEAAQIAVNAGTNVIISSGKSLSPLSLIQSAQQRGTLLQANDTPHNARKRWIGAHLKPKGIITIDDGAVQALLDGKSLLPVGVKDVQGDFERGDAVQVLGPNRQMVAIGLISHHSADANVIKGKKSQEITSLLGYTAREVLIHRNDMILSDG